MKGDILKIFVLSLTIMTNSVSHLWLIIVLYLIFQPFST
jgi:hypothetical protein